ncbi:GntR family transcriptional regulator [Octadecabacter temperatus]|nr:GntR family transcriptional regulator [Octadecabacter temperatus]
MQSLQKVSAIRPRLADLVYDQIVGGLQSGAIDPNVRLHQVKLAEMLDVSRTPVREALLRLEQEGVLRSSVNGGFEIRRVSKSEVRDIYQARQAVEGFCAGLLASLDDKEMVETLRETIAQEEGKKPDTNSAYFDANRTIHRAFVATSGNAFLLESFDAIWNRSIAIRSFEKLDAPGLEASLSGHLDLLNDIRSGGFEHAQRAMHDHIIDGCALQLAAL